MSQPQEAPVFAIEKTYVKDLSIEVPNAPEIFLEQEGPAVEIQLRTEGKSLGDGVFEVVLTTTVTAKVGDKVAFLVEVSQAGIFQIRHVPQDALEPLMAVACPNILFPFAREAVADATTRAGFQPVLLQPVNFEALYSSSQQQPAAATPHEVPVQ